MKKKRGNGFTLAELLVVVAIIGVLVAVSIPIFTGQLEKARIATDKANVRAAKVAAVAEYLNSGATGETVYFYDAADGVVKSSIGGIKGYGKSTSDDTDADGVPVTGSKANLVKVVVTDASGASYEASWVAGDGSSTGDHTSGDNDEFGDGSGGDGSDSSGTSGGSGSVNQALIDSAKIFDSSVAQNVQIGEIYTYNNNIYISLSTATLNAGGTPEHGSWYEYAFVQPTATVYTSKDSDGAGVIRKIINYGDLYSADDGSLYICKGNSDGGLPIPTQTAGNWVKILQDKE